ncbi:hypothetical protein PQO01_14470 [Lentisphaera marina]|uniref:hypothetical protein n=1 Tax=Lentisphaera marina TaxID=1111041 RepID=UPI002365C48E|nr:hypothetical protein [Lentisphaera marina]MDD7986153.1 hypothetical protein [Lentisphaera marina]
MRYFGIKQKILGFFLPALGFISLNLQAELITSQSDGKWGDKSTWDSSSIPKLGDQIIINHHVEVHGKKEIGHSPKTVDAEAAIIIQDTGKLELKKSSTLLSRGGVFVHGSLVLAENTDFQINAEGAGDEISYPLCLSPTKEGLGKLILRGRKNQLAKISSVPLNRAFITDGHRVKKQQGGSFYRFPVKGGSIDAEYAHFYGLGNDKEPAWQYSQKDGMVLRILHSLFEKSGRIEPRALAKIKLNIEYTKWQDSLPLSEKDVGRAKALFRTSAKAGSDCTIRFCDFDELVSLSMCFGYSIEDSIFRKGIVRYQGKWHEGDLKSFERNLVRWPEKYSKGGIRLAYGETFKDCIFIQDYQSHNNPHFMHVAGKTGIAKLSGCIFWFTGPNDFSFGPEGDGPMTGSADYGSVEDNKFIIEKCIMMPNSLGPNKARNLSANLTSGIFGTTNSTVILKRNTAFSSGSGGVCIGETNPTVKGALTYVKSNLFVGSEKYDGIKVHDFHLGVKGAVRAQDCDYNVGYRLRKGSNYVQGKTGKGYNDLKLVGDLDIGKHDIDDIDPVFVDPFRTPYTWSSSLKGDGTMVDAMNQMMPTGTRKVQDLLNYLREGFRPQNQKLKNAGDPEDGSPDVGAVDL